MQHLGAEASERAASLMREINEAYRVLSDAALRREYDGGAAPTGVVVPPPVVPEEPMEAAAAPARVRMRPGSEVLSSVVDVFSRQVHKDLLARTAQYKWQDRETEGFDWTSVASFWTAQYLVGFRGFAVADIEAATKFTNYCNLALARAKHPLKQNFHLFYLAFQKANDPGSISMLLWRFCANTKGQRAPGAVRIVFMDVVRGKAVLCGAPVSDGRYQQLLEALRLSRAGK